MQILATSHVDQSARKAGNLRGVSHTGNLDDSGICVLIALILLELPRLRMLLYSVQDPAYR